MAENPVVQQRDGTYQRRGDNFGRFLRAINEQVPLKADHQGYVDDYSAVQLGLYAILKDLTFTTVDRVALLSTGAVEARDMQLQQVYLDFPDAEDERRPTPSVCITQSSATEMDNPYALVTQTIMEDTLDVYCKDTVLQKLYEAEYRISLVFWLANKDDRAAVRKRVVEVFGVEPDSDLPGRRVALPWYFDRQVRINLVRVAYDDDGQLARFNTWPFVAEVTAQLPVVQLVQAPPCMRTPPIAVDTSGIG